VKILGGDYHAPKLDDGSHRPKTTKEVAQLWTIRLLFVVFLLFILAIIILIFTGYFTHTSSLL